MTPEERELLFKDLCSRLPYGVKLQKTYDTSDPVELYLIDLDHHTVKFYKYKGEGITICDVGDIERFGQLRFKPYLFPLSSMTKEQYKEWCDLEAEPLDEILTRNANCEKMSTLEHHLLIAKSLTDSVNYCYKNHFDIYGLIPMGLAIDATGLNIY